MSARLLRICLVVGLGLVLGGCPKSGDGDKPSPSATVSASTASTASDASASADASATDASSARTSNSAGASYAGTYNVAPATFYISDAKDFASVKQVKDDPSKHVGDGTLTVAVDAEGRVSGTIDTGPASPAIIDGTVLAGEIRGLVRRKDPKDDGLTGTLVAKITGESAEGELSLAEGSAAIVREGKLSLKKK